MACRRCAPTSGATLRASHERGHGSQRGQPQHAGDEQSGYMALIPPGHRAAARHPAQHPFRQRPRGLDSHQPHPQHGSVLSTSQHAFNSSVDYYLCREAEFCNDLSWSGISPNIVHLSTNRLRQLEYNLHFHIVI